ncbi:hypothetical protein FQN52_008691 [Onygenales sp. PD_12]|nr:hypothetical protein FQN52_008691 [Onygenales sp. PD_12]
MEPEVSKTGLTVLSDPESAVIDIVFIHGLQGDARNTWTWEPARAQGHTERNGNRRNTFSKLWSRRKRAGGASADIARGGQGGRVGGSAVFWPKDLLAADFPTARIMTFGYDSIITQGYKTVNQGSLFSHSRNLLYELVQKRRPVPKRGLVFIAHSLGGIIVKDVLRRSETDPDIDVVNIFESTSGILFFGTPHRGSEGWASLGDGIAKVVDSLLGFKVNRQIIRVLLPTASELEQCRDSFATQLMKRGSKLMVRTFQESRGMTVMGFNRLIVPPHSSKLDHPSERPFAIDADHRQMVRFKAKNDKGYEMVKEDIEHLISEVNEKPDNVPADPPRPSAPNTSSVVLQQEETSLQEKTYFIVPYPSNPGFIGRSATLDKLKERFGPAFAKNGITYQARAALFGLGGIGKTQIALAFAYWAQKEYPSLSIFWIHASTPERFRQGAAQIAQECKVPGHNDPKADVAQVLKVWLEEKIRGPWLMVLDNADDVQMFFGPDSSLPSTHAEPSEFRAGTQLRHYIPNSSHGAILVTSRNKSAAVKFTKSIGADIISVDGMDGKECNDLIRTKLGGESLDPDDVTRLMDRLEHVPLAIIQAVSFLQHTSFSISRYLELLDEGDNVLVDSLSQSFEAEGRDDSIQNAVTATWIISFDQIREQYPAASDIFARMCFFDRQAIPEQFLSHRIEPDEGGIQPTMGQFALGQHLGVLKAFSFISESNDRAITMHRLVHLVMRRWLNARGESEWWAREALRTVSDLFPDSYEVENWKTSAQYFPHANAVLRLEGPLHDQAKLNLLGKTATFLTLQGRNDHAEELLLEAISLAKRILGEEHRDTLFIMHDIVEVYFNQGRLGKAEELGTQVVESRKEVLGPEHKYTLRSMELLARIWTEQQKFNEAQELGTRVLDMQKRIIGLEHEDTLHSMHTLARIRYEQGQLEKAENMYSSVVEERKRVMGPEHPSTLFSMNDLSITWRAQGQLEKAEKLQREAWETGKRTLGKDHPYTLIFMSNLAWKWKRMGRDGEAVQLLCEFCRLKETVLGKDHPDTVESAKYLKEWIEEQSPENHVSSTS